MEYLLTRNVFYFLSTIINRLLSRLHCEQKTFFRLWVCLCSFAFETSVTDTTVVETCFTVL